jgi:hypothetical protein
VTSEPRPPSTIRSGAAARPYELVVVAVVVFGMVAKLF